MAAYPEKNPGVCHELYGTGTTGTRIMEATNLHVHRFKSGPLGGNGYILDKRKCLIDEYDNVYDLFCIAINHSVMGSKSC